MDVNLNPCGITIGDRCRNLYQAQIIFRKKSVIVRCLHPSNPYQLLHEHFHVSSPAKLFSRWLFLGEISSFAYSSDQQFCEHSVKLGKCCKQNSPCLYLISWSFLAKSDSHLEISNMIFRLIWFITIYEWKFSKQSHSF